MTVGMCHEDVTANVTRLLNMSNIDDEAEIETPVYVPILQYPQPPKKLKPARKQVKAGDVNKTETVQTGKEYSEPISHVIRGDALTHALDIWYNKWAGGDREDNYSKSVSILLSSRPSADVHQ